jgi:hypothetical protein
LIFKKIENVGLASGIDILNYSRADASATIYLLKKIAQVLQKAQKVHTWGLQFGHYLG